MQREERELEAEHLRDGGQEQVFVVQPAEAEDGQDAESGFNPFHCEFPGRSSGSGNWR